MTKKLVTVIHYRRHHHPDRCHFDGHTKTTEEIELSREFDSLEQGIQQICQWNTATNQPCFQWAIIRIERKVRVEGKKLHLV